MLRFRGILFSCLLVMLLPAGFVSCEREKVPGKTIKDEDAEVSLSLAFALETPSPATKANYGVVTELSGNLTGEYMNTFRGMSGIRLLAFDNSLQVKSGSWSLGRGRALPNISSSGLMSVSNAHLFPEDFISLPPGTTAVLAYGTAPRATPTTATVAANKHLNGSLQEIGWESATGTIQAKDIRFRPDPIAGGGQAEAKLGNLVTLINTLVSGVSFIQEYYYSQPGLPLQQGSVSIPWNETLSEARLKELFLNFISGGSVISACGPHLEYRLTALYKALKDYDSTDDTNYLHEGSYVTYLDPTGETALKYKDLYNGLKTQLIDRFDQCDQLDIDGEGNVSFKAVDDSAFPAVYGLPDGAVRFQWRGGQFVKSVHSLDGKIDLYRYCYMPPLFYFVNTGIRTSLEEQTYDENKTWTELLSQYRQGPIVTAGTKSVALERKLQYACGLLSLSVKATTSPLKDKNNTDIPVLSLEAESNFPLTGIIIGSQYEQNFDFSPRTDNAESDEILDEYYLYDNETSGMTLTTSYSEQELRTLSLPTPQDNNVFFYLEFQNNSGIPFEGRDGVVEPGFRFYLLGTIDLVNKLQEEGVDPTMNRVFLQDHYTTIKCLVNSLANAYLTIPTVGNPQLVIGIQTQLDWVHSPGSYVVLE